MCFEFILTCLPCCYLRPTHCFAAQNPQTSSVEGNTPWSCSSHGHPCHKNQLRNDGKWCGYCIDSHSQGTGCPEKVRRAGMKASKHHSFWAQGGEKIAVNDIIGFLKFTPQLPKCDIISYNRTIYNISRLAELNFSLSTTPWKKSSSSYSSGHGRGHCLAPSSTTAKLASAKICAFLEKTWSIAIYSNGCHRPPNISCRNLSICVSKWGA